MGSSGSPLAAGSSFGQYRIAEHIGSGGMSILYRATDESLDRDVALKVMAPDLSEDPEFRERFSAEARVASRVDHPHIVPIYAFGDQDGRLYIAMRYIPGEDLRAVLRRVGRLEPAGVLAALEPVAAALDAVHRAGLVHRDVKPDNVLVQWNDDGTSIHPYLADFGLTRTGSGSGLTKTGQMLGTLAYAAPEQIRGEAVGPATDVYALGAVLYECLTGAKPFPRDNEGAVIYAHLSDPPPLVGAVVADLPAALDEVVGRALAKDAAARYQGAGELMAAVRAALDPTGTGTDADATPLTEIAAATDTLDRLDTPIHRGRRWTWSAAAVVLVMLASTIGLAAARNGTAHPAADGQTTNAQPISAEGTTGPGGAGTSVTDPASPGTDVAIDPNDPAAGGTPPTDAGAKGATATGGGGTGGAASTGGGSGAATGNGSTGGAATGGASPGGAGAPTGGGATPTGPTSAPSAVQNAVVANPTTNTNISNPDCGGEPSAVTVSLSWTTPAVTGGSIDRYELRVHRFASSGGPETMLAANVIAPASTTATGITVTVPRSNEASSYYGYEVVAVNAKGSGPAARVQVRMPSVIGLCSWTMWQMLRTVGLPPSEDQTVPDPEPRADNRVFAQTLAAGAVVQSGTLAAVRSYKTPF